MFRLVICIAATYVMLTLCVYTQQAIQFTDHGDLIEVPHSSELSPDEITIEFWVRVYGVNGEHGEGEQTVLDKRYEGNGYNIRFWGTEFPLGIAAVFEPSIVAMPDAIEQNLWYHVAAVQTGDSILVYLNGELKVNAHNIYAPDTQSPLRIGQYLGYPHLQLGLHGDIDEFRIWNYARASDEIQTSMHMKLFGDEEGLVGYWDFEEIDNSTVPDKTSYNNDGIIFGNPAFIISDAPVGFVPPPQPTGLRAYGNPNGIQLKWKPVHADSIVSYGIYVDTDPKLSVTDENLIAIVDASDSSYADHNVIEGLNYYYRIISIDEHGRRSNPGRIAVSRATDIRDNYFTGVYYYPWYGPHGHHWEGEYTRDYLIPKQPPLLGHYSSRDEDVIKQHFDWMDEYGIDFIVSSWWGIHSHENVTLRDYMLQVFEGRELKFTVYYELAMVGPTENGKLYIDAERENRLVNDYIYIAETYFDHPNFLTIDDRPVVFLYISRILDGDYVQAFDRIRDELLNRGYDLYLVGDELHWGTPSPTHMQFLDAVSPYLMHGFPPHDGYPLDTDFLADISTKTAEWERVCIDEEIAFIPVVFPGFNDKGIRGDMNYILPHQISGDASHTSTYEEQIKIMRPFVDDSLHMIMITSWNEWHEDTQIEPTIITEPTSDDVSGTGFYTEGYAYKGYGVDYLETTRSLLAPGLPVTAITEEADTYPERYFLHQNFPNPFNSSTQIRFTIPEVINVTLTVYDVLGRNVALLLNEDLQPGDYSEHFEANNLSGGIYFYRLTAGSYINQKSMIFVK